MSGTTTLLIAKHSGVKENGADGCYTRWANNGLCAGIGLAAWLNSLGPDAAPYSKTMTNGEVRANWLRGSEHLETKHVLGRLQLRVHQARLDLAAAEAELDAANAGFEAAERDALRDAREWATGAGPPNGPADDPTRRREP